MTTFQQVVLKSFEVEALLSNSHKGAIWSRPTLVRIYLKTKTYWAELESRNWLKALERTTKEL
jgi:hypothetical protein